MFNMLTPFYEFVLESFWLEMVRDCKGIQGLSLVSLTFLCAEVTGRQSHFTQCRLPVWNN